MGKVGRYVRSTYSYIHTHFFLSVYLIITELLYICIWCFPTFCHVYPSYLWTSPALGPSLSTMCKACLFFPIHRSAQSICLTHFSWQDKGKHRHGRKDDYFHPGIQHDTNLSLLLLLLTPLMDTAEKAREIESQMSQKW